MSEGLMYDLAHEAELDVYHNGRQYEIRAKGKPNMSPLRLTLLDDVLMFIKATLEH